MTYELAKQLKDAGFPQIQKEGSLWWDDRMAIKQKVLQVGKYLTPSQAECFIKIPTLSELIEWCGENIKRIDFLHDKNEVIVYSVDSINITAVGINLEESVAKLGLELNKTKISGNTEYSIVDVSFK